MSCTKDRVPFTGCAPALTLLWAMYGIALMCDRVPRLCACPTYVIVVQPVQRLRCAARVVASVAAGRLRGQVALPLPAAELAGLERRLAAADEPAGQALPPH